MPDLTPQLAAYKGLRGDIIAALKRGPARSAKELAQALGVSVNAVRHHLKELERAGVILHGREQRGVGAPSFAYRLAPAGEALFPRRYEEALTWLVEWVVERDGPEAATRLFQEHYRELFRGAAAALAAAPAGERVALVARLLSEAGYMADWQEGSGVFQLAEHNCAMRAVAERFPEVCRAEENFLREALGATVERRSHIPSGCSACEYTISFGGSGLPGQAPEREPE